MGHCTVIDACYTVKENDDVFEGGLCCEDVTTQGTFYDESSFSTLRLSQCSKLGQAERVRHFIPPCPLRNNAVCLIHLRAVVPLD